MSRKAKMMQGVRQGYILSPILFNMYNEEVRALEEEKSLVIDGRMFTNTWYAGCNTCWKWMWFTKILNDIVKVCKSFGMEFNERRQ